MAETAVRGDPVSALMQLGALFAPLTVQQRQQLARVLLILIAIEEPGF